MPTLASLAGHKYALIVTYRRTGEAVPTPVWFGIDGRCLYFQSAATGHKLRRIAQCPSVLIAPCTARGRPTDAPFHATARILELEEEEEAAEQAIRSNYGIGRRLFARFIAPRVARRYVEVCP